MFRRTRPTTHKRRLAIVSLFVLTLLGVAPLRGEDEFEPVRQRIAKALTDTNVPSIAVAVAREGKIVWEQGFGWADRENRVSASEHTLYSLASISKPITATALMVLKERGKLDLDKPANDYLGDVKLRVRVGEAAEATLRRVANHTAGLPLHYQFFYVDESYRAPSRDETIRRYGNLVTAPGERFQYSNLGYGVLDYVIERAGGRKFSDVMREDVFLPLGMTHTSVDVGPGLEAHQAIRGPAHSVLRFRSSRRVGRLRQRARPGSLRHVSHERASGGPAADPVRRGDRRDAGGHCAFAGRRRVRRRLGSE
jgi:CubicO group peptidase (beta-lactamase class C family)